MLLAPISPRPGTRFSGWRIVVLAAVGLGMTGPGQTPGVSVFVDHIMAGLDLSRSQVSMAYMIGTLAGAAVMPRVGRLIDERGSRVAMAVVGGGFGVMLAAMSGVQGLVTLVIGFAGIRMFGQGGLNLVSTTSVAPWFDRRRGLAIGLSTAVGGALISLVPISSEYVIRLVGWRSAWLVLAGAVWLIVLPIAVRGLIDRPADVGQEVDGISVDADDPEGRPATGPSFTRAQALRTPMFWAVAGAVATTGMIGTGLAFHQIDLLGEQGLTPIEAAANFLPQTAASLTATLAVGTMVDRFAARWVLLVSMLAMAGAMVAVPFVSPGWSAMGYGMLIGAAGSSVRALEAASFPKLFGIPHLGSIRGVVTALSVGSTAFGPLALSIGHDLTGSYVQVLLVLLIVPLGIAIFGLFAPQPRQPAPAAADNPSQPPPRDPLG